MRINQIILCIVFPIAIIGCRPDAEIDGIAATTLSPTPIKQQIGTVAPIPSPQGPLKDEPQMTQPAPTSPSTGLELLIEKAKEDLAQRLSISIDQIDLIEAKAVTWPDASLGCPQSGMAYAEVLTSGYLILLEAKNKEYEYHASRGTEIAYCENPNPPVPGNPDDI